ncbi:hypothetical protein V1478_000638 [Vespula squamosa]|uniref:Uncharacterized protein n=1 Tax=Vespula squamosa TaxID=30214 RepID=A0ABD2C631_VESSQ
MIKVRQKLSQSNHARDYIDNDRILSNEKANEVEYDKKIGVSRERKIHRLDAVILCLLRRQFQIQRTRLEIHGIQRSSGSDENLLVNIDIHATHN